MNSSKKRINSLCMALSMLSASVVAQTETETLPETDQTQIEQTSVDKATAEKAEIQKIEPQDPDLALWERTKARPNLVNLGKYLEQFPNGDYASEARERFDRLEIQARKQAADDKALDAYRKTKIDNGLVLELDARFDELRPYVRSMLNSCGYQTVEKDRFAKKVYPTISIDGSMFNGRSDLEHSVTLNLSVVLKTKNRQIKARERMLSYRTSELSAHKALQAAFEDIGAQMKSGGFCI